METCRRALTLPSYQRGERGFNSPELSLISSTAFQVSFYIGKEQLNISAKSVQCDAYAFYQLFLFPSFYLFYWEEATEEHYLSD